MIKIKLCYTNKYMKKFNNKKDIDIVNQNSWTKTEYGYFYEKEEIKFISIAKRDSLRDVLRVIDLASKLQAIGIICSSLKESDILLLKEKKISYCIPDSEIKIFFKNEQKIQSKSILNDLIVKQPGSTMVVSPSGFEIVDTIFRLDIHEIQKKPSHIARKYKLSQPKISQMMTTLGGRTLIQLKEKLLGLELSWWYQAFDNPLSRRKMTPFKSKHTRKYAFGKEVDNKFIFQKIASMKKKKFEIEIGGLSYLKILGILNTSDYDLLVRSDQIADVVKVMNLRPVKKGEAGNIIWVTPLIDDIQSERLKSKILTGNERIPEQIRELNPLRYIWGLNYEEERVRDERKYLLEQYLNEARKGSD